MSFFHHMIIFHNKSYPVFFTKHAKCIVILNETLYYTMYCKSVTCQLQPCSQIYLRLGVILDSSSSELPDLFPEIGLRLYQTILHSALTNNNLILTAPNTPTPKTDLTRTP